MSPGWSVFARRPESSSGLEKSHCELRCLELRCLAPQFDSKADQRDENQKLDEVVESAEGNESIFVMGDHARIFLVGTLNTLNAATMATEEVAISLGSRLEIGFHLLEEGLPFGAGFSVVEEEVGAVFVAEVSSIHQRCRFRGNCCMPNY